MLWTKDGGKLPDLDRVIVDGRDLTFTALNKTDNGTYRCEASNHLGTNHAEYVLFVYGECQRVQKRFLLGLPVVLISYLKAFRGGICIKIHHRHHRVCIVSFLSLKFMTM